MDVNPDEFYSPEELQMLTALDHELRKHYVKTLHDIQKLEDLTPRTTEPTTEDDKDLKDFLPSTEVE